MTLRQATFYGRCALVATVALLTLGILVDTFWNPPTRVQAVIHLPSLLSVCVFIHWRGWVGGWKCRHDELTEVMRRHGIHYGEVTAAEMRAELAEQKRQREEDR